MSCIESTLAIPVGILGWDVRVGGLRLLGQGQSSSGEEEDGEDGKDGLKGNSVCCYMNSGKWIKPQHFGLAMPRENI